MVSAPLSVVKTTMVLSSSPMSSSFFSTEPMLSSICFMPASLIAPVLAAAPPSMSWYFVRQHGGDVHARRVVPDEERLAGRLRIVAVEEVDDLDRDLLVNGPRALERQRPLVGAGLVRRRAIATTCRGCTGRGGVRQIVVVGSTAPGTSVQARDRRVLAGRRDRPGRSASS